MPGCLIIYRLSRFLRIWKVFIGGRLICQDRKKDAKILNIKLAKEISDQLEQFCEESGMSKTIATEKILSKYFEEYFSRPEEERTLFK